jgi:putative membrane protein
MSENFWKISFQFMLLSLALIVGDWIMDGVRIVSSFDALLAALTIMVLNRFVKPLLIILTIPATIFTFGLFILAINAMILLLASEIIEEFQIKGFWTAVGLSLFLSVVQVIFGQSNNVKFQVKRGRLDDNDEEDSQ